MSPSDERVYVKLTEAVEAARLTQGPKCKLGQLLKQLPQRDSQELRDVLDNPAYQHTQISAGIESCHQIKVPDSSVAKHRLGKCSCAAV